MTRRIKEITIDNLTFKVGAFTINEAQELLSKKRAPDTAEQYDLDLACRALNLAVVSPAELWTVDRLKAELDWYTVQKLREQILELNGLTLRPVKLGEPQAAADSTSSLNSAAA